VEKLAAAISEYWMVIMGVLFAIFVYSFLQALISMLRDWCLVTFFKKKLNGNGKQNGKVLETKFDELIEVTKNNGEKHDKRLAAIERDVGDMHKLVTEEDNNNFPKLRVMMVEVKELWDKLVKGRAI